MRGRGGHLKLVMSADLGDLAGTIAVGTYAGTLGLLFTSF